MFPSSVISISTHLLNILHGGVAI